ncbi:hypothetical protein Tco_0256109 [Tanacetum coccineum]
MTTNPMHNDIMAAGSKKHPPMLALVPATPAYGENLAQEGYVVKETYDNVNTEIRIILDVEAEAVHIILNEWLKFVTIVKQATDLDNVSYHKLFDILKLHYLEVNELQAERLAKTANPLALVATTQQQPD